MSFIEWSRTRVRQVLAIALVLLLVVIGAVTLRDALRRPAAPQPAPLPAPSPPAKPLVETQPLPLPPLNLTRVELITAVNAASAAYAAGEAAPPANAALTSRSFQLRLPLGCGGAGEERMGWTYDEKAKALRIKALPEAWGEAPWVKALAGDTPFDAAEGFWIARPWSNAETCPTSPATDPAPEPSPQTFGLVQLFEPGGSRVARRGGRAYEHVMKMAEKPQTPPRLSLVLGGRLAAFKDGQPIRCRGDSPDRRPVCLAAVDIDHVAFEDQATGETLAEWRN